MEPYKSISIATLKISGFKCHTDEALFNFSDINLIVGGNHTGKTTIADAIAFAVTGQGFWGGHFIDKFYNDENPDILIEMCFTDENNNEHNVYRKRRKDKMDIAFDGQIVRQQDLNFLFGDKDEFLSMLNPLYFIEELAESGSTFLEKHLPPISHNSVMSEINERCQELLKNISFSSPEILLKTLREELRECEDNVAAISGQQVLLGLQDTTRENKIADIEEQMKTTKADIERLILKKTEGFDEKALQEELAMLTLKHEEMLRDMPKAMSVEDYTQKLREITNKLICTKARVYESKYANALADLKAQLDSEKLNYIRLKTQKDNLMVGKECPQCLRLITKNDILSIHETIDKQMVPCVAKGSAVKAKLKDVLELNHKSEKCFSKLKNDDIAAYEKERLELETEYSKQQAFFEKKQTGYAKELQEVYLQRQTADEKIINGSLSIDEALELKSLEEKLMRLEGVYSQLSDKSESGDYKLDEQLRALQCDIKNKNEVISAVIEYIAKKAELLFKNLSTKNVQCRLYDIVKSTGEMKKTFKFTYKGRDYRRLSRSERLLAGMEITEMLRNLTGKNYPVFVDDSESIENIPKPDCQIFLAKVMRAGILIDEKSLSRTEVEALCPFCSGTGNNHLYLNTKNNKYFCQRCKSSGNSVSLYAKVMGIDNKTAFEQLSEESKLFLFPQRPIINEKPITIAPLSQRHDVYYDLIQMLSLSDAHKENLLKRGMSEEQIVENAYRTMPSGFSARNAIARELLKQHDLHGVPGFFKGKSGDWRLWGMSGILIPYCTVNGYIQGLQIRLDNAEKKKYRWLSSDPEKGFNAGAKACSWTHITGNINSDTAYITEGALKGDTASYLDNNALFLCNPGVGNTKYLIPAIKALPNVKKLVGAYDMDQIIKEEFSAALNKMEREISVLQIPYSQKRWNPKLNGIDEYYLYCRKQAA